MENSLFSALRIVALMLAVDHEVNALERSWFSALTNTFGANFTQRKILREDLNDPDHADVENIYRAINEKDKARLLNLLTMAMHIDKVQAPAEKAFYARIKELSFGSKESQEIDYAAFGRSLQKRDKEIQLWKELEGLGKTLNQRRGMYWAYPYDSFRIGLLSAWIVELLVNRNKTLYITLMVLGFMIFGFFWILTKAA